MNAPVARSTVDLSPAVAAPAVTKPAVAATLPPGESLLWQGAPDWTSVARRVFHVRGVALYFAALWLWQAGGALLDQGFVAALRASAVALVLAVAALGLLALMAWLIARSTVYTITDRRVVMQIGVALPMAINVPFKVVQSAGLARHAEGTGDITLALAPGDRFAYLHIWPHVRPWRLARPEPMLRCLPKPDEAARILADALAAANAGAAPRIAIRIPGAARSERAA